MKLFTVTETITTAVGLMRPGVVYELNPALDPHRRAIKSIVEERKVGREVSPKEVATILAQGFGHYPDDTAAPIFAGEKLAVSAKAPAK